MSFLRGPDPQLLFSRKDPHDIRLGEIVQTGPVPSSKCGAVVLGWPDDEGIRMNGGRPGAAEAPDRIRQFLYRMTPPADRETQIRFHDAGNLDLSAALPERHQQARATTSALFRDGHSVLTLGGGHDYGFPDTAAFLDAFANAHQKPLVVNFDAHLDVRPTNSGFHSGTPFRRLLEEFHGKFEFLEIGLQPQCNSRAHRDWAIEQGAELWFIDEVREKESMKSKLEAWLASRQGRPLFVSLDIDAISSVSAPGCSQSWDQGLESARVFQALEIFDRATLWKGLGIYEVSPALDIDNRTSKLAAQFAYDFLVRRS